MRKIAPSNLISLVAGTGTLAYKGDGGPGTAASLKGGIFPFPAFELIRSNSAAVFSSVYGLSARWR